ncbi:MAG TPA: four helix bundle protein [Gemmatimonadaceae bacterium]|nr:four helix bundle protein [Gemmatimonadaceae bacterium]
MNPIPRLKVSGKAHELTLRLFQQTRGKAWSHEPVLRERLQRSALAVPLHITRGARDENRHNFSRALDAALGALRELAYTLVVARDIGLLTTSMYATLEARAAELDRMLVGLRHKVRSSGRPFRVRAPGAPAPLARQALQSDGTAQPLAPDLGAALGVG